MKMQGVIAIAKKWDIPFQVGISKVELIRAIQQREGYTACFRRVDGCPGQECLWYEDCVPGK